MQQELLDLAEGAGTDAGRREAILKAAQDPSKRPLSRFLLLDPAIAIVWLQTALGAHNEVTWQWREKK